jgi:hypothetical protein
MEQNLEDTIAILASTPSVLTALLTNLPEAWTLLNEGGDTWNVYDVVGHLAYGERSDWMPRVTILLTKGEGETFPPFDRLGQKRETQHRSLHELLEEFARLRTESLRQLRDLNLTPSDLKRRGRHPAFGLVTLSELLATWATHDLNHLHQISRILAHQYRAEVGPWAQYLGVLQCDGHSAP